MMKNTTLAMIAVIVLICGVMIAGFPGAEARGGIEARGEVRAPAPLKWRAREFSGAGASFSLGAKPPTISDPDPDVVILFDGTSWDGWVTREGNPSAWKVLNDRSVQVVAGAGDALRREDFGDLQLHVEFMCPLMADAEGQARGNSGVYLHGLYEVQVLDSFGLPPAIDGCGAVYGVAPPAVNASRPPNEWQTYDIFFRGPRFDDAGAVVEQPRITVLHNGVLVHNNLEIPGSTRAAAGTNMLPRGPILLQDHGNPVRYRNIWARRLE